jgi:ATP-binding cassette subfamily F protein 3
VIEVATGRAGELPALERRLRELEAAGQVGDAEYLEAHAKHDALNDPHVEARPASSCRAGFS